jgi:hypothetical protein
LGKRGIFPGVFNFGAVNNVWSALYQNHFTPYMKRWGGGAQNVLDISVKRKIFLTRVLNYSLFVTKVPLQQPELEASFL